eukprot:COSAG02_NODE_1864_length_10606_cov_17.350148_13_plen_48_part_01
MVSFFQCVSAVAAGTCNAMQLRLHLYNIGKHHTNTSMLVRPLVALGRI